jgi:hypothetical protein
MAAGRRKLAAVLLVAIVIAATVMLSAALPHLELSPQGRPLPSLARSESKGLPLPNLPGWQIPDSLFSLLLILFGLLMLVFIAVGIISPKTRKRTISNLVLILGLVVISLVLGSPPDSSNQLAATPTAPAPLAEVPVPPSSQGAIGADFELATAPPPWLIWSISLVLALTIAAGLAASAWVVWRATHLPASSLEQLAGEAQEALAALRAGADPRDTILRCYLEMSRVLRQQRGIVRNQAMTPREFESSLTDAGLPSEQVRQLTRLFELVRYGARLPAGTQEQEAVACLTAIVESCRNRA